MTPSGTRPPERPRNLVVIHLESISWQTFHAFPESFPNLRELMAESRTYRMHFSSATSTQMVLSTLLHANDREMDAAVDLAPPVHNNPSFLNVLCSRGYSTAFLCATAFPERPILRLLSESLPPLTKTRDFADLLDAFEQQTATGPFAIYVWSQVPHISATLALAPHARALHDLLGGGGAVIDNLLGALVEILRRRGSLEDTTILAYGDHGDDFWTHGFKLGLLHGVEPYTPLVHTPLIIRDARLGSGIYNGIVSTVDLGPTVMSLLGVEYDAGFSSSGKSVLETSRNVAFSQNYTASQPDDPSRDVRKAFAAIDRYHALHVSSRGLALYNHRLDPGNHTNLLHFSALNADGQISAVELSKPGHEHLETVRHFWYRGGLLQEAFAPLRDALLDWVTAKNDHAASRNGGAGTVLGVDAFERIDPTGRDQFFNRTPQPAQPTAPAPHEPFNHRAWRVIRPIVPPPVRRVLRTLRRGQIS